MRFLIILLLAGCGTTVNMTVPQPNLQTLNLGQPNCHWDCTTTHTATQGDGSKSGDISHTESSTSTRTLGAPSQ